MPIYVYRAMDPKKACDACREPFDVLQKMSDDRLTKCPECDAPVEKQVTTVNAAFPKGPAALRSMGMARLEKRSDGNYENVSAQPGEPRTGSLESFGKSLSKGKKPILSD